jgi:hypothetical protein
MERTEKMEKIMVVLGRKKHAWGRCQGIVNKVDGIRMAEQTGRRPR